MIEPNDETKLLARQLAEALFWNGENPICVDNEEEIKRVLLVLDPNFPFVVYQTRQWMV